MGVHRKWQQWKYNIRHHSFGQNDVTINNSFRFRNFSSAFRGSRRGKEDETQMESARKLKENVNDDDDEKNVDLTIETFL